ncbi:MAG TPA: ATP-grasp domain-containing protein [Candidatus Saccharimonadales bacterium]|nr:ATP-grasp domain-containing protein [Candidatus Saccharimonadales bacterium]
MNMTNTSTYIYHELQRRHVPVEIIHEKSALMRYKYNDKWHLLEGCLTEKATIISCHICDNKIITEMFARNVGLPVLKSVQFESDEQATAFMQQNGPIVVKPVSAAHGHGISLNVVSKTALKNSLRAVRKYSKAPPVLQQMVYGKDIRILVIGGNYQAAVRRVPATVIGDGEHTIKQLIEIENNQSYRSSKKSGELKIISLHGAKVFLGSRIDTVPKKAQHVAVVGVGNTSMGGHGEDITDDIPQEVRKKSELFVRALNLPVCGIDIMLEDNGDYHFIEANARPGFGPHHHPRVGTRRDVTKQFVDCLLEQQ